MATALVNSLDINLVFVVRVEINRDDEARYLPTIFNGKHFTCFPNSFVVLGTPAYTSANNHFMSRVFVKVANKDHSVTVVKGNNQNVATDHSNRVRQNPYDV